MLQHATSRILLLLVPAVCLQHVSKNEHSSLKAQLLRFLLGQALIFDAVPQHAATAESYLRIVIPEA